MSCNDLKVVSLFLLATFSMAAVLKDPFALHCFELGDVL